MVILLLIQYQETSNLRVITNYHEGQLWKAELWNLWRQTLMFGKWNIILGQWFLTLAAYLNVTFNNVWDSPRTEVIRISADGTWALVGLVLVWFFPPVFWVLIYPKPTLIKGLAFVFFFFFLFLHCLIILFVNSWVSLRINSGIECPADPTLYSRQLLTVESMLPLPIDHSLFHRAQNWSIPCLLSFYLQNKQIAIHTWLKSHLFSHT